MKNYFNYYIHGGLMSFVIFISIVEQLEKILF